MNYAPYQLRVIEEKRELDFKIEKLAAWTQNSAFQKVEYWEQRRQFDQLYVMNLYSEILSKRIAAFTPGG